jgi:mannose-6-phosphate isomerase
MSSSTPQLYPLLFEPALVERVWGGRQLETRLGKKLPAGRPIGESWEIYWKNRIANGEFRGKTLGDLIKEYPEAIVGSKDADPEFPLLIKFIDAQDWLSVQVHPDDKLAAELEGEPRGKTECWYILDAAPNAQIVYGFSQPVDADDFRKLLESGHGRDVLQFVNVAAGDFIYVPAGTMHAIGPGILLYELQQTSDTTYRVYDWDRMGLDGKPRELHIDKSMRATHFDVKPEAKFPYTLQPALPTQDNCLTVGTIIEGRFFGLEKLRYKHKGSDCSIDEVKSVHTLSVISGSVTIKSLEEHYQPLTLSVGQSALLPAQLGHFTIYPEEPAEVLRAYLPTK